MYEPSFKYKGITINYHFMDNKTIPTDLEIIPTRMIDNKIICIDVWGIYKGFERRKYNEVFHYVKINRLGSPVMLLH